jgi:hypothetical protein
VNALIHAFLLGFSGGLGVLVSWWVLDSLIRAWEGWRKWQRSCKFPPPMR